MTKITANNLMQWGMANLLQEQKEIYAIRHSGQPVSDFPPQQKGNHTYSVPNFFERAFPCLYPYGQGGLEAKRPTPIQFKDHIKWSLQYFDRRFQKHETFPFVCFSILQHREALGSARLQMNRRNFEQDARVMATITREKLEVACLQEERKKPITDPAVHLLRKSVQAAAGRVMGSNQARYQMRSQIWSTSIYLGPPSLWITINPSDLHDPIAQVFASKNINLDDFVASAGPNSTKQAENIASDLYAASKFFHFLINTILETLFGVKIEGHRVKSSMGILGQASAYFGLDECQGRGTLHLHLLIYLVNAPSADEMHQLLTTLEFRARVVAYI